MKLSCPWELGTYRGGDNPGGAGSETESEKQKGLWKVDRLQLKQGFKGD